MDFREPIVFLIFDFVDDGAFYVAHLTHQYHIVGKRYPIYLPNPLQCLVNTTL